MAAEMVSYGVAIRRAGEDHVVDVRDLPEVVTSGSTLEEALDLAADAIAVAVAGRREDHQDLPAPSPIRAGEHRVRVAAYTNRYG